MSQSKKLILTRSNFFVLQILIYFYIISESFTRYGLIKYPFYLISLLSSVVLLFFLDYRESKGIVINNQPSETIFFTLSVIIILAIFGDFILERDSKFFFILVYISPIHLVYSVFELIKGKTLELDHLSQLRDYLEIHGRELIFHLIPLCALGSTGKSGVIEPASNLQFFTHRIYQKANLNEHRLQEMNLLFIDNSDDYSINFCVPNKDSVANLSDNPFVELPSGFEILKYNTLKQLYFYRFAKLNQFDNWLSNYLVNDISFSKSEDFHLEIDFATVKNKKVVVNHSWEPSEIVKVSKEVIESLVDTNKDNNDFRISEQFEHLIKASRFKTRNHLKIFLFHLACISESELVDYDKLSRYDKSMIKSYNNCSAKLVHAIEDVEQSDNYEMNFIAAEISDALVLLRKIKSNPVKYFVQYHDYISTQISSNENLAHLESIFDDILSSMMFEIDSTKNLQHLIQNGSLGIDKLSKSREGIVAGAAISLYILTKIEVLF